LHAPGGPPAANRHPCLALIAGSVVRTSHPVWSLNPDYVNPLSPSGQLLESTLVDYISPPEIMNILTDITKLPSDSFPTRSAVNASASASAVEYLRTEFGALGLTTCSQSFSWSSRCNEGPQNGFLVPRSSSCRATNENVIAYIPGGANGSITVGAHYDSRPFEGAPAPGADDNGSGVAVLLALARAYARLLREHPGSPQKTIYFVAFGAEEEGLFGSDAFAAMLNGGNSPSSQLTPGLQGEPIPTDCMPPTGFDGAAVHEGIIMDMVGWPSPNLACPTVNLESYEWATDVVEHLAQASRDHNGDALVVTHNGSPFGSDHMSWLRRRMPAALLIHGDDEEYPDYHTSGDVLANNDASMMAVTARMGAGGLMRLAGWRG